MLRKLIDAAVATYIKNTIKITPITDTKLGSWYKNKVIFFIKSR